MFIPFISKRQQDTRSLAERKGGGGGGGVGGGGGRGGGGGSVGGGGRGSAGGGRGGSSSSSGGSKSSWGGFGSSTGSTAKGSPRPYSNGGGRSTTIPSGSLFAGRSTGGGQRAGVFGSSTYGSGYPGYYGRGVSGLGFPFYFWPLAFGSVGGAAYLYNDEYGLPSNTSRPGGAQSMAAFQSNSTQTIYRIASDNDTVVDLIDVIQQNCSSHLTSTSATAAPYDISLIKPEQIVQYYRASSAALSIDGYNNSAVFSSDANATATPLPSSIDTTLLECLNSTIGQAIPLVDGAWGSQERMSMGTFMVGWIVFCGLRSIL